eukprot:SAG31_NODE_4937_length_2850_cov_1.979644_2_plen_74_part_00
MRLAAESAFPAMHGRFILKNATAITVLTKLVSTATRRVLNLVLKLGPVRTAVHLDLLCNFNTRVLMLNLELVT